MSSRKKRLKKGISSLQEQIDIHEQKKADAKEKEDKFLEEYYGREIEGLKKTKLRKEKQLKKAA